MEFCPACFQNNPCELNLVVKEKNKKICSKCGEKFHLNTGLISENVVRTYIKYNREFNRSDKTILLEMLEEEIEENG